jgi:hypothetical protein
VWLDEVFFEVHYFSSTFGRLQRLDEVSRGYSSDMRLIRWLVGWLVIDLTGSSINVQKRD